MLKGTIRLERGQADQVLAPLPSDWGAPGILRVRGDERDGERHRGDPRGERLARSQPVAADARACGQDDDC